MFEGFRLAHFDVGDAAIRVRYEASRHRLGSQRNLPERAVFERAEAELRSRLGSDRWSAALADGRARPLEQVIEMALAFTSAVNASAAVPVKREGRHDTLTSREQEVMRLVIEGKTNPEIARMLFISPATVRVHVSNVLAKLGASTRTQAADLARRRGLL